MASLVKGSSSCHSVFVVVVLDYFSSFPCSEGNTRTNRVFGSWNHGYANGTESHQGGVEKLSCLSAYYYPFPLLFSLDGLVAGFLV